MEKLVKENIVYILFVAAVIIAFIFAIVHFSKLAIGAYNGMEEQKQIVSELEIQLHNFQEKNKLKNKEKKSATSGKIVYEVPKYQFSPEASFGIMFENILANVNNSGIRVRSIEYNYTPAEDRILSANVPGYNGCELAVTAVGSYTQLQNFFKSIAKEKYLSSLYEVHIEPYDRDKTILIAKFKLRIYTKSV